MDYSTYLSMLRGHQGVAEVSEYGRARENGREYPLVRLVVPGRRWLTITAGFHGEEPAGPLTLAERFAEIADHARRLGVGLKVYPCINPSGFEAGTRYNASGEQPNNDFLRYEVSPGVWRGELRDGEPFLRWRLFDGGPQETRALRAELEASDAPAAALDLHQDRYMGRPGTYAYVFGAQEVFAPLVHASSRRVKVAIRCAVDELHRSDELGLVRYHDGSVTDYFLRRGVPHCAALETTTHTPMVACHEVNLIWILGFIELAARADAERPRSAGAG